MQTLTTLQSLLKRSPLGPIEKSHSNTHKLQSSPRVLAVDDTQTNLQLLCIFLEQLGANVTACASGKEAVRLVKEYDFDLVFMDYRMPDLNGLEATKIIRKNEKNQKHLPIIGLTAHAMPEEKKLLLKAGMDDCITKPVDEDQLYQVITKWVDSNQAHPNLTSDIKLITPTEPSKKTDPVVNDVVNITDAIQLVGGKEWLAKEMFEKLIDAIKKDKKRIIAEKNDSKKLQDIIHSLHGATRYCGVPALRRQAQATEMLLNSSPDCQEQIELEVNLLIEEIDKVINWSMKNQFLGFQSLD